VPGNPPQGTVTINHAYGNSGTYTIKQVLFNGATVLDSLQFSYSYTLCNTMLVSFYYDGNGNCIFDSTESLISQVALTEVDSNNIPIDTISSISGFYYTEYGNAGDVYKFRPISIAGYTVTCPLSGELYDTLAAANNIVALNFGLTCLAGNSFDLSINPVTQSGRHTATVSLNVNNAYCSYENAIVTMNYSPKYAFNVSTPSPITNVGQTVSWNLYSVTNTSPGYITANFGIPTPVWLTVGDTVIYTFSVTPTAGDTNPANNTIIVCDTITGAWDPNHIAVSPQGHIAAGTQLKYSIEFENTGNAPAENIYVLDTLPDQVDVNSLRMVAASAHMYITMLQAGGHNIVKFEFPNINLPDSVHFPGSCTGMFVYTVKTKTGLPDGTLIDNRAGIYFDYNDVMMTNTVENIIGFPDSTTSVIQAKKAALVSVYPNPATSELTIKTTDNTYSSFTITNSMGQIMLQQELNSTQTKVNVKELPAGMYYVNLKGANGNEVRKFVKM